MEPAFNSLADETRSPTETRLRIGRGNGTGPSIISLEIPDVKLLRLQKSAGPEANVGGSAVRRLLVEAGIEVTFVEDNCSVSSEPGTIRGLHFQGSPRAQAKLVRVVRGSALAVAVDIRPNSSTFGRHVSATLTAEAEEELYLPVGFAHGFCTLEADTEVAYKASDHYSREHESGIAFDDPELAIDWPLGGRQPIVSDADRALPPLRQFRSTGVKLAGEKSIAQQPMRILVTGGAGFVGSAVVRHLISRTSHTVLNLDKLTAAASDAALASVTDDPRYELQIGDICDTRLLSSVFREFHPDAVLHLAAETNADRPVAEMEAFLKTNTIGTMRLLQAANSYYQELDAAARTRFRFQHVSTAEVYGGLSALEPTFSHVTHYEPLSPYSASKAAADHIVRAWGHTYGLPVVVASCADLYGPYQSFGNLVPQAIIGAAAGRILPEATGSETIRDWLFVEDLAEALAAVLDRGQIGSTYLLGGIAQRSNRQVVGAIADLVEDFVGPLPDGRRRRALIPGPDDLAGGDYRYPLVDASSIEKDLGWLPAFSFEAGLRETVSWYLKNEGWWRPQLRAVEVNGQTGRAAEAHGVGWPEISNAAE
jgi:dTDP-glucose 4,6-dehydratase